MKTERKSLCVALIVIFSTSTGLIACTDKRCYPDAKVGATETLKSFCVAWVNGDLLEPYLTERFTYYNARDGGTFSRSQYLQYLAIQRKKMEGCTNLKYDIILLPRTTGGIACRRSGKTVDCYGVASVSRDCGGRHIQAACECELIFKCVNGRYLLHQRIDNPP